MSGHTSETHGQGFKLSVEDLDIRLRVWVWIWRLVLKSSAEFLGIKNLVQVHRPRICRLVLKSKYQFSTAYQGTWARVSDVWPEFWNSDIRHDEVILYCILIVSIFFYVANLKTRFDETQEPRWRIWGLVYKSRLKPSAGYQDPRQSFRYAAGYLKLRY